MTEEEQLKWGSHLPPLMACLAATTGPVLELGVGHFSTPVLHAYCAAAKRVLVSVEDNLVWYDAFKKYQSPTHHMMFGNYNAFTFPPANGPSRWGVSFIDNSPGGLGRSVPFSNLIGVSDYVVVHDYHHDNEEFIGPLLTPDIFWSVYRDYEPPTLIASRTLKPPL